MWIRSQDKMQLVDCNTFRIVGISKGICNVEPHSYEIIGDSCTLGTYSTKEKALDVMVLLEQHIFGLDCENEYGAFDMPQDNEVEE